MEKAKISPYQLFTLIVLFELGTALIVPLGVEAKQDAWIAELLGLAGGIVLLLHYFYLYHQYPDLLPTQYIRKIFGQYLGYLVSLLYIVFFIYGASRDLRDASELLLLQYDRTPMFAVSAIIMLLVSYALYHGIEVLARTGELIIVMVFLMITLTFISIIGSDVIRPENLLPVLENGWKPVLNTVFPYRIFFPHGELICFIAVFPFLNTPKTGMKYGLIATILSGLILTVTITFELTTLGVANLSTATFPFLQFVEKINIAGFIQGLQGFAVILLVIGAFFKVAVFAFAAVKCAGDLFQIKNSRKLVTPISLIVFALSFAIADNFIAHMEQGKVALRTVFPLFGFIIPLLLIVVDFIRNRMRNK
ncbi:GerAB/ArcD/ProY family transporter [Bacillus sp. CLL-7-23]|uniref:GerAB/ArcD/ProY family transporter n=1 Tax=Bacillus changyiensis TaxID=3004103 RepID=A0ABT4X8T7_9BACI|nr:GerAB/ArcD/ProY family transporter [Bacillus changyiensis]MDA7027846.1 GerAB/ArcD/ProY family transporter [Bacillus changyiensis]